jgi:uncharacterized membrane protein YtjA (UPF0391 family)
MLYWAAAFLAVAIVAGLLGFGAIAAATSFAAQVLFVVFAVFFLASLIAGLRDRGWRRAR